MKSPDGVVCEDIFQFRIFQNNISPEPPMALKPCKECKREISSDANACPHCGKKNPANRTRSLGLVLGGVLILSLYAALNMGGVESHADSPSAEPVASAPPSGERTESRRKQALDRIKLEFTWRKGGFETAMIADFVITNPSPWRVKDLEVTCEHFGPSGTKIDSNVRTIYEIVEAKSAKRIKEFNMGFVRTQATQSSCSVTNLVVD